VEKILASAGLAQSPSLSRFLRFVVEETLAGRQDTLKEYTLGVYVFDRGDGFDPRTDSIVRVQGTKLRARLAGYYSRDGAADPVRIELPRGSYAPRFVTGGRARWWPAAAVLVAVVVAACALVLSLSRGSPPRHPTLRRLTYDPGVTLDPTVSADGKWLAFASDREALPGTGPNLDIWIRQRDGGEPARLTRDPADDHQPALSPDGRSLVFRSERQGGGLYVMPALGGEPRKLSSEGQNPCFSPDSTRIAYWVGRTAIGKIYIAPVGGGSPQTVLPDFYAAIRPVWSPDGGHLLFRGRPEEDHATEDWWVAPVAGGRPVRTGAYALFRQSGVLAVPKPPSWTWSRDRILFHGRHGDSLNLWSVRITNRFLAAGPPERLTLGTEQESQAAVPANPSGAPVVVFSATSETANLWSVPVDHARGAVTGHVQALTQNNALNHWLSASSDGSTLVYATNKSGNSDIWIKDLRTGVERPLVATPAEERVPTISPSGSLVAYEVQRKDAKPSIYMTPAQGGVPRQLCDDCELPTSWSPDERRLLILSSHRPHPPVRVLDVAAKRAYPLTPDQPGRVFPGRFSPDGRWATGIAFGRDDHSQIVMISLSGKGQWAPVTDGLAWDDFPIWSPSGNLLYFSSDRDGFRCIWAQPISPGSPPSAGAPFPVHHLHDPAVPHRNDALLIAASRDRLFYSLRRRTANLWMTSLR